MGVRTEERMKILEMLQEGVITSEEANRLLQALDGQSKAPPGRKPRWLHIKVTDTDANKTRVNVSLPVSVAKAGLKMGARFAPDIEGFDVSTLEEMLFSGGTGHIVDVIDEGDGERVEIYLE